MEKKMIPFMEIAELGYYNFADGVCRHRRGCYYWLDKISVEKKESLLAKYNNICFCISRAEYAPEIKHPVIFVADVPFDTKFEKVRKAPHVCYVAKIFNGCKMYSVKSCNCKDTETRYFHTKKEAEHYIRISFTGLEKAIRLNDLRCA